MVELGLTLVRRRGRLGTAIGHHGPDKIPGEPHDEVEEETEEKKLQHVESMPLPGRRTDGDRPSNARSIIKIGGSARSDAAYRRSAAA